jgi:hypothetical protein
VNVLRQKFGPFEVWVWLALVTALLLAYWLYERNKTGAASTAATTAAAPGVVVDTGTGTGTTQQPVPPAAPALTAAQTEELADVGGLEKKDAAQAKSISQLKADAKKDAAQDKDEDDKRKKPRGKRGRKPGPGNGRTPITPASPAHHPATPHPARRAA